ncbi:MAG: hypothetical protein HY686_01555 [Chloroflexi bacterium]|nr:hypothetical protein [Chloroflexota bacterium]
MSWAITNDGPADVGREFFVDLYFDDSLVERWTVAAAPAGGSHLVRDWADLPRRVRILPGPHILRLVIDPTDVAGQRERGDTAYAITAQWDGPPPASKNPPGDARHLPNLVPYSPPGWDMPLQVYSRVNGQRAEGLAAESTTFVRASYGNWSGVSTDQEFYVHLYLDDLVVAIYRVPGLLAGDWATSRELALREIVAVAPGWHTLKLVVDATSLVDEADKRDNVFSRTLYWGPGAGVPATQAPEAQPPTAATPEPFAPPGWDGPVVATATRGLLESGTLVRGKNAYVHWALRNSAGSLSQGPYRVQLLLDGKPVALWRRPPLDPGGVDLVVNWNLGPLPRNLSAGPHTLALAVDSGGTPAGITVGQVLYQRTFFWVDIPPPPQVPAPYSPQDIQERVGKLGRLLQAPEPTLLEGGPQRVEDLLAVADAVYYALYKRTLQEEPLSIYLLSDQEFETWVKLECQDTIGGVELRYRERFQKSCAQLQGFSGYRTSWQGRQRIVLRGQRPPAEVLATLAHELGHSRQSMLNPSLDGFSDSLNLASLREAQAYAHQVLFLRTLEALADRPLMRYPRLEVYERYVSVKLGEFENTAGTSEHSRGRLLLWMALLTDRELQRAKTDLILNGSLTFGAARAVFQRLLELKPTEGESYVIAALGQLDAQLPTVRSLALSRLASALPPEAEGVAPLRDTGLLLP